MRRSYMARPNTGVSAAWSLTNYYGAVMLFEG